MTTDEFYAAARDRAYAAARALTAGRGLYGTPDGARFAVDFRPPLRVYQLEITRTLPGQDTGTTFSFQRGGRVCLGGDRKLSFREMMALGHEAWASRGELDEIAGQLAGAEPAAASPGGAGRTRTRAVPVLAAAVCTGSLAASLYDWAGGGRLWWPAVAAPAIVLAWLGQALWRSRRRRPGGRP